MKIGALCLIVLLCGCSYDHGQCVLVSANSWDQVNPIKGKYIKFSAGSHWYSVNGETKSMLGAISSVTSCPD